MIYATDNEIFMIHSDWNRIKIYSSNIPILWYVICSYDVNHYKIIIFRDNYTLVIMNEEGEEMLIDDIDNVTLPGVPMYVEFEICYASLVPHNLSIYFEQSLLKLHYVSNLLYKADNMVEFEGNIISRGVGMCEPVIIDSIKNDSSDNILKIISPTSYSSCHPVYYLDNENNLYRQLSTYKIYKICLVTTEVKNFSVSLDALLILSNDGVLYELVYKLDNSYKLVELSRNMYDITLPLDSRYDYQLKYGISSVKNAGNRS
jgi:hypothetical protein